MSAQRQRKEHIVSALSERFKQAQIILVAHYDGSSMEDLTALRGELVPYGGVFHITKNKLALLALKGSEAEFLSPLFSGPTAIAFANDEAQITHISKALVDFGKNCEHIRIIGGAFAGQLIDENGVKNLANLPSLDGVRALLIGLVQAPATKLAILCNQNATQIARLFQARSNQTKEETHG